MEIYTEGDTNTYGQLYCSEGALLDTDNDSNGNGNFKITAYLEAGKQYYINVCRGDSSIGYGEYTLRLRFVKDFLSVSEAPNGANWKNDSYNLYDPQLRTLELVYIDDEDCIKWREKLQQQVFVERIKTIASQGVSEVVSELLSQGFSVSFSYNMAGTLLNIAEILTPSLEIVDFDLAYDDFVRSGKNGFVISHCWMQLVSSGIPFHYVDKPMQEYLHYNNSQYMYGLEFARGHFEYH